MLLRHTCMLMTSALLAASSAGMASVTLIDADFDANTTGLYGTGQANGATIAGTSGTLNVSANGVSKAQIVSTSSGHNVLELVDNDTSVDTSRPVVYATFAALSTTSTGNNYVKGCFDFTELLPFNTASAGLPQLVFQIGTYTTTGSANAAQLTIRGGTVTYYNGTDHPNLTLPDQTHQYHVDVYLDLSGTQDTWGFSITDLTTNTLLYTLSNQLTRGANTSPTMIVFNGGLQQNATTASPFVQLDNIQFTAMNASEAVPEPATAGILASSLLALVLCKRR